MGVEFLVRHCDTVHQLSHVGFRPRCLASASTRSTLAITSLTATADAAAATGDDYMRVEGWGGGNSGLARITGRGNRWSVSVASGLPNKPML